jgi:hypothetical protein
MAEPAFKFSVKTYPDTEVLAFRVRGLINRIEDLAPLFEGFGTLFKSELGKQFMSEGANSGGWAPLSPAYAAWKADHFPGRPIGVLSGALRRSMTGGEGYGQEVGARAAWYGQESGPALKYGSYFDEHRTVIAFSAGASARWRRLTEDWAYDQARASGWGAP